MSKKSVQTKPKTPINKRQHQIVACKQEYQHSVQDQHARTRPLYVEIRSASCPAEAVGRCNAG